MAKVISVPFPDEGLLEEIQNYSEQRKITINRAITELTKAGNDLLRETGQLTPLPLCVENRGLKETNKILKSELGKVWGLVGERERS